MEEDEEVVFQESALFSYFQEIGIDQSEFECSPRHKQLIENHEKKYFSFHLIKSCWQTLCDWKTLLQIEKRNSSWELQAYQNYLNVIRSANVLLEEDDQFLSHWNLPNVQLSNNSRHWTLIKDSTYIVIIAVVCEFISHYFSFMKDWFWIIFIVLIMIPFVSLCYHAVLALNYHAHEACHRKNVKQLQEFLTGCSSLADTMRKSINLIRELELVARGFTLLLPGMPVSKLGVEFSSLPLHSCHQHCPALRATVFSCSRENLINFRNATRELLKKYKLSSGIDHDSHYIAMTNIEELTSITQPGESILKLDLDLTKNALTVDVIKLMWHLSYLQMSEFIRRFGLCLFQELHEDQNCNFFQDIYFVILSSKQKLASLTKKLNASLDFHKSAMINLSSLSKSKQSIQEVDDFQSTQIAIHSLVLHLQAALNKAVNLDAEIENMKVNTGTCDINKNNLSEDVHQHLTNSLKSIKLEMEACMTCHDESLQRIDSHYGLRPKVPSCFAAENSINLDQPISSCPHVRLIEMGEPVIEDQVFEAIVTNDDQMPDLCIDEFASHFEHQKQKQEAEYSQKVLKELKSVLEIKADEWREREEKALAKVREMNSPKNNNEIECESNSNCILPCLSNSDFVNANHAYSFITNDENEENVQLQITKNGSLQHNLANSESTCNNLNDSHDVACPTPLETSTLSSELLHNYNSVRQPSSSENEEIKKQGNLFPEVSNLGFVANVAAMAAARSHLFKLPPAQTFSDEADVYGSDSDEN